VHGQFPVFGSNGLRRRGAGLSAGEADANRQQRRHCQERANDTGVGEVRVSHIVLGFLPIAAVPALLEPSGVCHRAKTVTITASPGLLRRNASVKS